MTTHARTRGGMLTVTTLALAALAALVIVGGAHAQQPGGGWQGAPPTTIGVHAGTWAGGSIEQAAATPGTQSLWIAVDGRLEGYVVGAPAFVNARFRAQFAGGTVPPGSILIAVIGATTDALPAAVVQSFMADLDGAAPPASSEPALVHALSRLTDQARGRLATSGQLAAFVGVQDLPDVGVTTTLRAQTALEARVLAVLQYSGGDAEREFTLVRERDRWRIDWVDAWPVSASSTPERVAEAFLAHFIASAPPAVTPYPAIRASELLTAGTRAGLDTTVPLSSALAALVGVQDVPDMGFAVAAATLTESTATLTATLHYSGGDATRTFDLVREDGAWRIDAIRS